MSGDELQVIPEDLADKAAQIRAQPIAPATTRPAPNPPDALDTSAVAIANLAANAESMWAYQEFGGLEGLRLAQTLDNVAAAYAEVDEICGQNIDCTVDGPGSTDAPGGTQFPAGVDLPAPPHPPSLPVPRGRLPSEQLMFPPETQRALEAGDGGTSLEAVAHAWRDNARSLLASGRAFQTNALLWEGAAADAAYAKFNAYRDWLIGLAGSWELLAGQAERVAAAHSAAKRDHKPIAEEFARLQQEIAEDPANAGNLRRTVQMAALQNRSEEIRNRYARDGQPVQIQPADPPSPVLGAIPVTVDDHRRARSTLPNVRPDEWPQAATARGDGSRIGDELRVSAGHHAASAMPAERAALDSAKGAAARGGGTQVGGTPGAGTPGGGSQGMAPPAVGSPGRDPGVRMRVNGPMQAPADPNLRPASFGGRAGGAGAAPPMSLQPAVGAETVAPPPGVAGTPVPTPTAVAGPASGMGGMGGMAPMMHGVRGEGAGEKKRNPQLAADTELYTEDRPWTEAVVGNRVRRRGAPDDPPNVNPNIPSIPSMRKESP